MSDPPNADEEREGLPLSKAAGFILDECRMVLPGIQALFGFQLIAVFNSSFFERLSPIEQTLHLAALSLTAIGIAFVMTPAAFHRQTTPKEVSEQFIRLASRLLLLGMLPLLIAICLDFYLVARIITGKLLASVLTVIIAALFASLWFILPRLNHRIGTGRAITK